MKRYLSFVIRLSGSSDAPPPFSRRTRLHTLRKGGPRDHVARGQTLGGAIGLGREEASRIAAFLAV